jgi:PAS domain S-box-containing protein
MPEGEPDGAQGSSASSADASGEADSAVPYAGLMDGTGLLGSRPPWLNYLIAFCLTVLAVALRRLFDVFGEEVVPFSLFYPVVLASTLLGGFGPGVLSLLISGVAVSTLWLDPRGTLSISGVSIVNFVLFAVTSAATIAVAERLRAADQRLRRNEERLTSAQEVGGVGIWDWNLSSGELWWSSSFCDVTGIDPQVEPSLDRLIAQIHPNDRDKVAAALASARQGCQRLDIEFRIVRPDGKTEWLVGRAELFRDGRGNPSHLLGVMIDSTRIRNAESERDHAHRLIETFFECVPGAAYAKDAEGRMLLGNPGFQSALGHDAPSYIGKTDLELIADQDLARAIMEHDRTIIQQGRAQSFEEDLVLPDGRLTHWLSVKSPFKGEDGKIEGIIGISLDITERRKAEKRLRYLANEVDHRARNLLGVVLSVVRLTKVDDVAAFRAAITGRIKALSRAHSLLAAHHWQGVDLAALVAEELAPFERAGTDRVTMSGPAIMLAPDASQALAMALHELASNAARYGALSAEQGRVRVSWRLSESGDQPHAEIFWNETGGPPVTAPALTGFGFTAIQGAIEHQLGGKAEIEWAPEGMTCRISFPVDPHADQLIAAPPAAPKSKPAGDTVSLQGKHVLIVDDEPLIALTMKLTLQEQGCVVMGPARSSAAAIELIKQQAPDIAILDLNLAGKSSVSTARALRALGVPYIYCTGYADPANMIGEKLSAETLTKPAHPRELIEALRRALGGHAFAPSGRAVLGTPKG